MLEGGPEEEKEWGQANSRGQWLPCSLKWLHYKICSFCPLDFESCFPSFVYSSVWAVAVKTFALIRRTNPLWEAEAVIIPFTNCPYVHPGVMKSNCCVVLLNPFSIPLFFDIWKINTFSPAYFTNDCLVARMFLKSLLLTGGGWSV